MDSFRDTFRIIFGCCIFPRTQEVELLSGDSSEPMRRTLEQMRIASRVIHIKFLPDHQPVPYSEGAKTLENTDVTVAGLYTARCVGVACVAEIGDKDFLVSDSFAPCVPIVIFAADKTWLAHINGMSGLDKVEQLVASSKGWKIRIVRKTQNAQQAQVANRAAQYLRRFSPRIVNVRTRSTIGVVVSAISKTILVYNQKSGPSTN